MSWQFASRSRRPGRRVPGRRGGSRSPARSSAAARRRRCAGRTAPRRGRVRARGTRRPATAPYRRWSCRPP
ncbi:hypothetical protein E0H92_31710 [Kribbella speibonae]|uniref:Uncharacterized protein n=1 Tax=Kribbella speibonae TaxID=1572660 RepID=A0A4R0IWR5_9ACTN|nr:hypothetical protein E0H92_31710 [Kribbella speibonae]